MNFETISIIIFILILGLLVFLKRKRMEVQKFLFPLIYILIWRGELGIKKMDFFAKKFRKPLKYIGYLSIFIGFLGMGVIVFGLVKSLLDIILKPEAIAGVGLVLPIKAKGIFYVPFFYWIISIFVLAIVHEFSHGVFAKYVKLKVKSSGFAILGLLAPIIPAAFVEPDEKEMIKRPVKDQLMVYSAGPFANILTALLVILLMIFVFTPITDNMMTYNGVEVNSLIEGYPAFNAGITEGEIINSIDGQKIILSSEFSSILSSKNPNDIVNIITNKGQYLITLVASPSDESKPYLGVYVSQSGDIKESYGKIFPLVIMWVIGLLYWLYVLNLGIGLFNLVPLGPLDGGRMLLVVLEKYFKKDLAKKMWKFVSLFFLVLILSNLIFAFIR
jgi:membrane-associated protease RseP (regulator of RpoE activity)